MILFRVRCVAEVPGDIAVVLLFHRVVEHQNHPSTLPPSVPLLIITMVKVLVIIIILAREAQITAFIISITEAIVIKVVVMVNVMVKVEALPVSFDCSQ